MSSHYDWVRFLVPRGGSVSVDSLGLLRDPEDAWGALENPDLVTLPRLEDIPVLVILGEPGMGKTTLLREATEVARIAGRIVKDVDLADFGSEDSLVRDLRAPEIINAQGELDLLIDSFDTGLLAMPTLSKVLAKEVRKYPTQSRLRLRFACRSAAWPESLERTLIEHWGVDAVKVFELAPLRRCDVSRAAQTEGLDDSRFFDQLRSRHAGPFATLPVTLRFLLDTAKAGRQLPTTRAELYLQGCKLLCAEDEEARRESGQQGRRSAPERLAVAARIAAILILTTRETVWTGARTGIGERDLLPEDFIGQVRLTDGSVDRLSREDIEEALATGLFSLRGPHRRSFSHQTYGEFLAAWYLHSQQMPTASKLDLLCNPGDRTLVPQLREVAAWAAALDEALFRQILDIDPPALLTSDVGTLAPELREVLVDRVLELAQRAEWADTAWGIRAHYLDLAHKGLVEQLRPWIMDSQRFIVARRIAIDIAEACALDELQEPLLAVALNAAEAPAIRVQSIDALAKLADEAYKERLLPLLDIPAEQDPADQIKGSILQVLWPGHIDFRTLSRHLHPPRQPSHLGAYWRFLAHNLAAGLAPPQVPEALAWIRERITTKTPDDLDRLDYNVARSLVAHAFRQLDQAGVATELAKTVVLLLRQAQAFLPHDIADSDANPLHDDMVRRRLLLAIFPLIQNPDSSIGLLIRHHGRGPQLIGQEDVPWLLDLGLNSEFPTTTWTLARLLQSLYNPTQTPDLANRILEACEINPVMRRALRSLWRPVSLSSRQARSAHESREFWVQMEAERRRSVPDPPPKERVAAALGEIEAGETIAFVRLLHDLGWSANGEYDYQEPLDLRVLPGWSEADPPTQARIVDAVCAYLESGDPEYERLIATDYALPSTRAAIRALYLRDALEREERRDLPQPDWYRWAPAMLPRFNLHEDDKHDWISDTLRRAYEQQPRRVLDTIERLLAIDLDGGQWVPTAHGLDAIWDQAITKIIDKACRVAAEQGLARPFQALFEQLARNAPDLAVGLGGDLMRRTADTAGSEPAKIGVIVAHALINQRMEVAWPAIWQTVQGNSEFARGLVLALAEDSQREADWWFWLPTPALGDLARSVEYGFFADASRHEASFRLEVLRNGLIAALVERGEPEAVAAMEGIVAVCPDTPWLRLRLVHARESLRRVAWCPPSPAELLETIWDTRKRLVRNDDELLSVIIESLARLHDRLHGWNGLVRALWNEGASPKPKEEDFLSDFVRDHLEQDLPGIIAHREVQVRRLKPRGGGERTDILVVAQTADARVRQATASVVIETKGCWHKEIHTAMEHQLKERYLIDSGHCRGLYLVGWYQPADKTSGQRQCSSFSKKALEETRLQLEDQAASLSVGEIRIRVFVLDARLPT